MIWYITGVLSSAYIGGVIGWVLHHYHTKAKTDEVRRAAATYRRMYKIAAEENRTMREELRGNRRREVYDYKKEGVE